MAFPEQNIAGVDSLASPTLERLLASVGGEYFDVVHVEAPTDGRGVCGVMIWDADAAGELFEGDLVLAVGVQPGTTALRALMQTIAESRCAAVVCKTATEADRADLTADAERARCTAIALDSRMSWDQIYTLVKTAIGARPMSPLDTNGVPYGDLFALANAAAAMLEGPVILDDENFQVLAFSNLDGPIDDIRRQSILHRRPPADFLEWCETTGLLPRIRQSARPVKVSPDSGTDRLVIAIKAGSEILGYLWVSSPAQGLSDSAEDMLIEIARVAAIQILNERVNADIARRLKSDALQGSISGRGLPQALAGRLGVPIDGRYRLIAFAKDVSDGDDQLSLLTVESLVSLHFKALAPRSAVTHAGSVVYVLYPHPDSSGLERARQWAADIIGRSDRQLRVALRAAIGEELDTLRDLTAAKASIDRLLALPSTRSDDRIICHEDSVPQTVIAELAEIFASRPHMLRGGVERLVHCDRERGSDYLATLRIYLECNCDLTAAAKRLFVHRNTLKYRIGRIQEMTGLDFSDPDVRLVAELHTRFLGVEVGQIHPRNGIIADFG
ncbi:PucR family transcriptional regulator [Gordonia desulfuricans]|uniref:PucR family transcriptional regulator n=1 Tax=Gordonia desulfuricans TaxID=89051 RepID=A0A7K3LIS3_9ACTN|nr:PucR family transcriptional regulator [Gordonia desulfuricans]NDK88166.1 PucR family transcriptional regulator [Gordonia desulfuricans]